LKGVSAGEDERFLQRGSERGNLKKDPHFAGKEALLLEGEGSWGRERAPTRSSLGKKAG